MLHIQAKVFPKNGVRKSGVSTIDHRPVSPPTPTSAMTGLAWKKQIPY
jgi:hypothetical protein